MFYTADSVDPVRGRTGWGWDFPAAGLPDSAPPQPPAPQPDVRSSSRSYFINPLYGEAEAEAEAEA